MHVVWKPQRSDSVRRRSWDHVGFDRGICGIAQAALRRRASAGRGLVQRPDLSARLSSAQPGGVVLVCAPAGSGKSMLLALVGSRPPGCADHLAWMSVERVERDEQRFWFLVDALARVVESVEPAAPSPGFRGEVAVDRLLSELDSLTNPGGAGDR